MNPTRTMKDFPLGAIQTPALVTHLPADGLRTLRVDMKALGNMYICFDATDEASVVVAAEAHLLPQRIERNGDALIIEGRNMANYITQGQKEKILIEVHVPAHTAVHLRMMAGVVMLDGGTGDVDIEGQFGEVTGISQASSFNARLQAGDISLNDFHGTARLHVSVGSITLGWEVLTGHEDIEATCSLGGLDLVLPAGIVPTEDMGGFFRRKHVVTPQGTRIHARVGFGGLDLLEWETAQAADALTQ